MFHEVKNSNNEDCVDDLVRLNDKRGVARPNMATGSNYFKTAVRSL